MICPICQSRQEVAFCHLVLRRHTVQYRLCRNCGLLQTEEPYWLDEAYLSPIAAADTGIVVRNRDLVPRIGLMFSTLHGVDGRYVDIAGGSGLLTRMMRDAGLDYYWSDKYAENVFARGFEADGRFDAASAIEVFEHVPNPAEFVASTFADTGIDSLAFTTELWSGPEPNPEWWYLATPTGQHIAFYQRRTLEQLASVVGVKCYSRGSLHLFTRRTMPQFLFTAMSGRVSKLLWWARSHRTESKTWSDHVSLIGPGTA